MKKILFLHGLDSKPGGTKVRHLEAEGYTVLNPWLPANNFGKSLRTAQDVFDREHPDIVVGSSRGGALALAMDTRDTAVVLIAPAWTKRKMLRVSDGTQYSAPQRSCVLHSMNDNIIDYEDSKELSDILGAELIECGTCHRMNDSGALHQLTDVVKRLIGSERE